RRIRRRAPYEGVEAAPVAVFARARRPSFRAIRIAPDAVGLRRKDAGAADLATKQTADRQRRVADRFGFQSKARPARQPSVIWVALAQLYGDCRRLPICS